MIIDQRQQKIEELEARIQQLEKKMVIFEKAFNDAKLKK